MSTTITVYGKPACVQCNATYRHLDKNGATYTKVDASTDLEARQLISELGYTQVPVVTVKGKVQIRDHWYGYRPDRIDKHTKEPA